MTPYSRIEIVLVLQVNVQEKRIRREIANSNERRRMQSINSGFSSLRSLLPHHEVRACKLKEKCIQSRNEDPVLGKKPDPGL